MAKRGNIVKVPDEEWKKFQELSVFATHDWVVEYGDKGILIVKRKIAPYEDVWALPGLRQLPGEAYSDTLVRVLKNEIGINIEEKDALDSIILGQFDGFFETRQDISTGRYIHISSEVPIKLNLEHFYPEYRFIKSPEEIPENTGEMYRFYLKLYFKMKKDKIIS